MPIIEEVRIACVLAPDVTVAVIRDLLVGVAGCLQPGARGCTPHVIRYSGRLRRRRAHKGVALRQRQAAAHARQAA